MGTGHLLKCHGSRRPPGGHTVHLVAPKNSKWDPLGMHVSPLGNHSESIWNRLESIWNL